MTIDSNSLRYQIAGRIYRIGTRVMTPEGLATVTGFDPSAQFDIEIKLDDDDSVAWTDWRGADLVDDEPIRSEAAEDNYRLRFG